MASTTIAGELDRIEPASRGIAERPPQARGNPRTPGTVAEAPA